MGHLPDTAAAQMVEQMVRGPDDWDFGRGWRRMEQIRQTLGRRLSKRPQLTHIMYIYFVTCVL